MKLVTCRDCGTALTDDYSRRVRLGSCCRKKYSPAELKAFVLLTLQESDPGYIPHVRPPSRRARYNNAVARIEAAAPTVDRLCEHDGIRGKCPMCRRARTGPAPRTTSGTHPGQTAAPAPWRGRPTPPPLPGEAVKRAVDRAIAIVRAERAEERRNQQGR